MNFFEKVYVISRKIPEGYVASYGQIALLAGLPRAARQVGWAMNRCPADIPAHRVVNREGVLSGARAFFLENEQESRLRAEGVTVLGNRVDMDRYGWKPDSGTLLQIRNELEG